MTAKADSIMPSCLVGAKCKHEIERFSCYIVQVKVLEYVGLAPEGSQRVSGFLEKAAEGLVEGGK
jgi:hypothetical protein